MTNVLKDTAEKYFGIKADPGDLKKLDEYILSAYSGQESEILEKVFSSGEAAGYLTVNETYFFRESAHFELLRYLLHSFKKPEIQICCAAVATGCEAYSIAMLIESYNKNAENPVAYHIDAFDINPNVIETACRGMYSERALREDGSCFHYLTVPYLKKNGDLYQIDDSLKKNICFFVFNLMNELPPKEYDIVFFRNAFIYFTPRYRKRILSNLSAVLKEGGILFLGVSETAGVCHADFEEKCLNDVFYFQKSSAQTGQFQPAALTENSAMAGERADPQKSGLYFDVSMVGDILSSDKKASETAFGIKQAVKGNSPAAEPEGAELAVSVLHLIKEGDFSGAGEVLDYMEALDNSPITLFLRGEYFFVQNLFTEAELYYRISFSKNDAFWPAEYRLYSLSSVDVLKKHRAEKTLEGLSRGRDFQYEVFIGGFSPDYYRGTLLKQKTAKQEEK